MIDKLRSRLGKGSFVRSVATLTLGTAFAQVLTVAAMPLLTRLYTPADFGFLAVFVAISSVVATAITLRYETAVLPAKTDQDSATLVLLCLACIGGLGCLLMASSALLRTHILSLLPIQAEIIPWVPLAVLAGLCAAAMTTAQTWLNRNKAYVQMASQRIVQSVIVIGLGLFFGAVLKHELGLMWAQVLASVVTMLIALWFARSVATHWRSIKIKPVARIYSDAPKFLLLASLMDAITLQLPVILISSWFGQDKAGQFSMAWRILMMPMGLVGAAIGQVFLQKFAQEQSNHQKARDLLLKTWRSLFFLALIPSVIILLFGKEIFGFALGKQWGEAGEIASIIAPMVLIMIISSPTSGTYLVLGLQKLSPIFGFSSLIYRPLCLYVGYAADNFTLGLMLLVALEIIQIIVYQWAAWHKLTVAIHSSMHP